METALENLSKEDLLKVVSDRDHKITYLESQLAMFRRMQFGQKRERFEGDPDQVMLPFEATPEVIETRQEEIKEKIEYVRKRANHHGRAKLPSHLPVEEIEIYPQGDLTEMVCIGREVTEELECEPARFFIKRYIRYKYATKNGEGVKIAEIPERVIDKGIPGAGLLASILTDKYMDHLPLYRQKQRFARENIQIPSSTIEGWTKQALEKLEPLYDQLVFDISIRPTKCILCSSLAGFSFACMNNLEERRSGMVAMIADWQSSGKSKKQYCLEKGINEAKFYYWHGKVNAKADTSPKGFIPIEKPLSSAVIEVLYPNGVKLKVENDLTLLSKLIHLY